MSEPTTGASVEVGLPLRGDEGDTLDAITTAAYAGDRQRRPEDDVRWLLALLARLDDRLTPDCDCACHPQGDDHCDACCQGPLCDDCRFYARSA